MDAPSRCACHDASRSTSHNRRTGKFGYEEDQLVHEKKKAEEDVGPHVYGDGRRMFLSPEGNRSTEHSYEPTDPSVMTGDSLPPRETPTPPKVEPKAEQVPEGAASDPAQSEDPSGLKSAADPLFSHT